MINVAILGAGHIAGKMARTLAGMAAAGNRDVRAYAVAARDAERAETFAAEHGIPKAYGSYEAMLNDPEVQLVYVATPHSHHYQHIRLCLQAGKHVLCEKPFTVNARQAEEVVSLARDKGQLLAEAIWTRYLPSRAIIDGLIAEGSIGTPHMLTANLAYPIESVERIYNPALAGGALLDVGVYAVNFASMVFGDDLTGVYSTVQMMETGVDRQESVTLTYADGKMAVLCASAACAGDCHGVVYGSAGTLTVDNINNPKTVTVMPFRKPEQARTVTVPEQITGFEYQVQACADAIGRGEVECAAMPHEEILRMMRLMDRLRAQWGLKYPFE